MKVLKMEQHATGFQFLNKKEKPYKCVLSATKVLLQIRGRILYVSTVD
jgi:hypothetical protein